MLQMSSILRGGGGIGASGGFPAPGIPNTTPLSNNPSAPFNLFAPPTVGAGAGAGGGMFNMDPAAMQQMLGVMGGMGDLDGWGAPALPAVPADARPPEERFQVQLQVSVSTFPHICLFPSLNSSHSNFKTWAS